MLHTPDLPVVHVSVLAMMLLLVFCVALAGYSYYRYKGGKSIRRIIRKRFRHWRKKAEDRSAPL
jgi:hypothetical protein